MRHLPFCCCLEGCRLDAEDLEDDFLSAVGSIDRVREAEEKGRHFLAAVLAGAWSTRLAQCLVCAVLYCQTPEWPTGTIFWAGIKSVNARVVIGNKLDNKIFELSQLALGMLPVCYEYIILNLGKSKFTNYCL